MAVDWGMIIGPIAILWIVAIVYKKKTGKPISNLWKDRGITRASPREMMEATGYQRVYVNRGIKT